MNETQKWFLQRLKDKETSHIFGDEILMFESCPEEYLVLTFKNGIFKILDEFELFYFGYLKDEGNQWNAPNFKRTNKQLNITFEQCVVTYKYIFGSSRLQWCTYSKSYKIDAYHTIQFISYIEHNIPYEYWFHFIHNETRHHINKYLNK
jgi:hypothetical protein